VDWAVHLARITRGHPKIKRGASVRAAIAVLKILESRQAKGAPLAEEDFWSAVRLALPTRIELQAGMVAGTSYSQQIESLLRDLSVELKKNS
jgi:hypothetical protein